jgi:hypothetical protein
VIVDFLKLLKDVAGSGVADDLLQKRGVVKDQVAQGSQEARRMVKDTAIEEGLFSDLRRVWLATLFVAL